MFIFPFKYFDIGFIEIDFVVFFGVFCLQSQKRLELNPYKILTMTGFSYPFSEFWQLICLQAISKFFIIVFYFLFFFLLLSIKHPPLVGVISVLSKNSFSIPLQRKSQCPCCHSLSVFKARQQKAKKDRKEKKSCL